MRLGMSIAVALLVCGPNVLPAQSQTWNGSSDPFSASFDSFYTPRQTPAGVHYEPGPEISPDWINSAPEAPPPGPTSSTSRSSNPMIWINLDPLVMWMSNPPLNPATVTTGPASEGRQAGTTGAAGTTSLLSPLSYTATGAFRLNFGGWLDAEHRFGLESTFLFLGSTNASFGAFDRSGTGNLVINEPIAGAPFPTQVSAPHIATGDLWGNVGASNIWGAELNALCGLYRTDTWNVRLLAGLRYFQVDESLDMSTISELFERRRYFNSNGTLLATAPAGSTAQVFDQFGTRNQFVGGQIGAQADYTFGRWVFEGIGKLAIGATNETVVVNGLTYLYPPSGLISVLPMGNYATLQNGSYHLEHFAVLPELQLNVGYQFTSWFRASIGYSVLYLSDIVRPGDQIDNTYGGSHPLVPLANSSFWAQGINFNFQLSY